MSGTQKLSGWLVVPVVFFVWGVSSVWNWASETLSSTGGPEQRVSAQSAAVSDTVTEVEATPDDEIFLCRAAIAEMMGRDLGIVKAVRRLDGTVGTNYRRPTDGKIWQNVCRVEGSRIVWASLEDNGSVGRWRTHPDDEVVTFTLQSGSVTIHQTFADGSATSDTFKRD
ncbi:hypothetical protein [Rhodobacter ferrooxidans]|uniref:hypothetical protein n=1 Tax=Rhodobacter ferrooxidans TaxID=371731 RepID=UPI0012E9F2E1|nr:hypothetical protein [Rhodobacter sp. SW2]